MRLLIMADAALLSMRTIYRQADLYVAAAYPHEAASSARAAIDFEFGSRWNLHTRARGSSAHAVEQMRATIMQMKGGRTSRWLSGSKTIIGDSAPPRGEQNSDPHHHGKFGQFAEKRSPATAMVAVRVEGSSTATAVPLRRPVGPAESILTSALSSRQCRRVGRRRRPRRAVQVPSKAS